MNGGNSGGNSAIGDRKQVSSTSAASTPTSRALILEEFGTLPRLVERAVPEPQPGHTLVRMKAATVAHLDLNVLDGQFGILPDLPSVPGTQGSGIVLASGTQPEGALVRVRGEGLGLSRAGAWAEHVLVPDSRCRGHAGGHRPRAGLHLFLPRRHRPGPP